jgi:hypothetical protein
LKYWTNLREECLNNIFCDINIIYISFYEYNLAFELKMISNLLINYFFRLNWCRLKKELNLKELEKA